MCFSQLPGPLKTSGTILGQILIMEIALLPLENELFKDPLQAQESDSPDDCWGNSPPQ